MQIRKKPGTDVIASGSLTGGEFAVIGDDDNVLSCEDVQLPDDAKGIYMFDVEFIATGIHETLIRGSVNIVEQITVVE
jgi:hypothetical protein